MFFQISVPVGPAAPAMARHALVRWLSQHATDGLLTDAPLVVSELVTNSLRHGGLTELATVRVSAELVDEVLRLEVEDAGTNGDVTQRTADREDGGGFGLNIVDTLATRWGVERGRGTLVWVEFGASVTRSKSHGLVRRGQLSRVVVKREA